MSPLAQQIIDGLPWLFQDKAFQVVLDSYDAKAFGNCVVVLDAPDLRLRFVRDRGQVLLDLASPSEPEKWWNLSLVLEALRGEAGVPGFELGDIGFLLRISYGDIVEALGPKLAETSRKIDRIQVKRRAAIPSSAPPRAGTIAGKPGWISRLLFRSLFWVLIILAIYGILRHHSSGSRHAAKPTSVLRVAVSADGHMAVNGEPASIGSLRAALMRLREQGGVVWYYREHPQQEPPPAANEVMRAIADARVPVRLARRPDFADCLSQ